MRAWSSARLSRVMHAYERYRPASRMRVLAFLAGLASRGHRTADMQAYLGELVIAIAFGVAHADFMRIAT